MSLNSVQRLKEFDEFYKTALKPLIRRDFLDEVDCVKKTISRFDQMVDYNVLDGKKLRGLCVYESLIQLLGLNPDEFDSIKHLELLNKAKAIGWCIEILQGSFLVADDIMDNSTLRRGKPCWYLNNDVGNIAINDSFYLLTLVYKFIQEFASDHQFYTKFYELFTEAFQNTVVGQGLDLITPPKSFIDEKFDFSNYTEEQYYAIVKWKTAFYSFSLPVQSALYLAGIYIKEIHSKCRDILIDMGVFFQVQDDYLDCYGDPKITGKVGTDIEESKCSWLVVQALKKSDQNQLKILKDNYGRQDKENVLIIKDLFNNLNLKQEYENYEKEAFERLENKIEALSFQDLCSTDQTDRIKLILKTFLRKFFKRNK